jgi:DNA-binding transcriptional LysR family regulator
VDIEDLRTFVEVADAGGVSTAARRLGISKSIVSRRLVRLEEAIGAQLLSRTTRGAALTEAGRILRPHAEKACAEIDQAKEAMFPAGELRGLLRIAAPLTFGPTHFAPVLAIMARRHPELQIHAAYSDRFADLVGEGFDCAIRVGTLPDSSMIARRVAPLFGSYVASPEYVRRFGAPQTGEELLAHQALMQGTESWQLVDGDQVVTIHPRGRFKADNGAALLAAALAGVGIAALPDPIVEDYVTSGELVRVMTRHPPPPAGIYVVRPPAPLVPRKVQVLIDLLIECSDQEPAVVVGKTR